MSGVASEPGLSVPCLTLSTLILSICPKCYAARNVVTTVLAEVATI